jgi:hypothetical protein
MERASRSFQLLMLPKHQLLRLCGKFLSLNHPDRATPTALNLDSRFGNQASSNQDRRQ